MVSKTVIQGKKPSKFLFPKEDYILYILNHLEPEKSDKIRLNKIAFFVEFAYIYFREHTLSKIEYAAIPKGLVIDNYDLILKQMQERKKVKIDGFTLRPLESPKTKIPSEVSEFIDPLIKKYSSLTKSELITLSHLTDSYKITTDNGKIMGRIVDKKLASLETFFEESKLDEGLNESELPVIDRDKLVKYEFR